MVSIIAALVLGHGVLVAGPQGQNGADGRNGQNGQTFGSLTGPDIQSPYLRWGGVQIVHASLQPTATTTSGVFCTVVSPSATSSVMALSWRPDNMTGVSSGTQFDIATTSNMNATSSPGFLVGVSMFTTQMWSQGASTTANSAQIPVIGTNGTFNQYQVNPNTLVVWRLSTSTTPGAMSPYPTGNCQAEFWVL